MRARRLLLLLAGLAGAGLAAAESVTVRPGDSLWSIAGRHDTTVEAIMAANDLASPTLNPGTVLTLPSDAAPAPRTWTVAPGDTLYEIATKADVPVDDLIAWNDLDGSMIRPGQELRLSAGATPDAPLTVQVGPGDTLWRIARAHDTTPAELATANDMSPDATLHPGDALVVPGRYAAAEPLDQGGYAAPTITVDPGDTLWDIARRYDTTVAALMAANRLSAESLRAGQELRIVGGEELRSLAATEPETAPPSPADVAGRSTVWPAHGPLTSHFGWRRLSIGGSNMHYGIDIDGETGDPIVAAAPGVVTYADWMGGFGLLVVVEDAGTEYYYAHASEVLVSEGQRVAAGDLIARIGTTGRVTGSHLHFEVRMDGSPVDPLPFLGTRTASR